MKEAMLKILGSLQCCAILVTLSACGEMLSVPQLREAENNAVVNVGDSIFALSGDIYTELHIKSGKTLRHYAITGTQMTGGILGPSIPQQYQAARKDDPNINVVYMDGGGNDVLLPALVGDPNNCKTCNYFWCGDLSQTCKDSIDDVYVERVDLLNQMARDGVKQVVYLGYYYPTKGILGDMSTLSKATDYGNKTIDRGCKASTVNCVFVNPTNAFQGHESAYIILDGIHPSPAGSKVLAELIWKKLKL